MKNIHGLNPSMNSAHTEIVDGLWKLHMWGHIHVIKSLL